MQDKKKKLGSGMIGKMQTKKDLETEEIYDWFKFGIIKFFLFIAILIIKINLSV